MYIYITQINIAISPKESGEDSLIAGLSIFFYSFKSASNWDQMTR
jgi:hypothetical protein